MDQVSTLSENRPGRVMAAMKRFGRICVAPAIIAGLLFTAVVPTGAVTNVRNFGPSNVTGYAEATNPEFYCSSAGIWTGPVAVWGLPGYPGQHVYAVLMVQEWTTNGWQWINTDNPGLHPGGYVLQPGGYVIFTDYRYPLFPLGTSAYYRAMIEVSWDDANFNKVGNIDIWPSGTSDYSGKYVYGSYCASGPWAA